MIHCFVMSLFASLERWLQAEILILYLLKKSDPDWSENLKGLFFQYDIQLQKVCAGAAGPL